jgi:hypothetical protein
MNESTGNHDWNESATEHHTEKVCGSGYDKGHDPIKEYVKGQSPDRRTVRNRVPEPGSTSGISSHRWEH